MMDERPAPGVQDGEEADLGAEVLRVGSDRAERLGGGAEEQTVDNGLVLATITEGTVKTTWKYSVGR